MGLWQDNCVQRSTPWSVVSHMKSHGPNSFQKPHFFFFFLFFSHGVPWNVEWTRATSQGSCCWIPQACPWPFAWEMTRPVGLPMRILMGISIHRMESTVHPMGNPMTSPMGTVGRRMGTNTYSMGCHLPYEIPWALSPHLGRPMVSL